MKIALLTPSVGSSVGGAETHTGHLTRILRSLGNEVTVLGPAQCSAPGFSPLPGLSHAVGARMAKRLPEWPHFPNADLVLSTDLTGSGVTHPRHLHVLMGSYAGFRRDAVAPAATLPRRMAQHLVTCHATWLERRAGRSLGALAPSFGLRERLIPLGLTLRPEIIPPPVDVGVFRPRDRTTARAEMQVPPGKWLLFAGRWEYAKGADRARALAPLLPRGWGILVAGPGLAQGWHAGWRIYSLGAVPSSSMPSLFAAVDATFLPSRFEGSSLVVAESLASGAPVLTTATGSGADLLKTGGALATGVVVDPTPGAWLAALDAVRSHGDGISELARAYAGATHAIPVVTEQWGALLATLTRESGAPGAAPCP
jgi:glycosyltransferase involved in cell wall biosynthesis